MGGAKWLYGLYGKRLRLVPGIQNSILSNPTCVPLPVVPRGRLSVEQTQALCSNETATCTSTLESLCADAQKQGLFQCAACVGVCAMRPRTHPPVLNVHYDIVLVNFEVRPNFLCSESLVSSLTDLTPLPGYGRMLNIWVLNTILLCSQ